MTLTQVGFLTETVVVESSGCQVVMVMVVHDGGC